MTNEATGVSAETLRAIATLRLSRHHEARYGLWVLRSVRVEFPEQAVRAERRAGRHADPHLEVERTARPDRHRRPAIELVDFGPPGWRENLGHERAAVEAHGGGGRVLKPDYEARDLAALRLREDPGPSAGWIVALTFAVVQGWLAGKGAGANGRTPTVEGWPGASQAGTAL